MDTSKKKVKTVHFLRHAQGEHNVAGAVDPVNGYLREDLVDAVLTEHGINQCKEVYEKYFVGSDKSMVSDVQLIVVSPMRRTLQTATHCFADHVENTPFVAVEHLREQTGLHPCDLRHPISEHVVNFPHICFKEVDDEDDPLYHRYSGIREPDEEVAKRVKDFFQWLMDREEDNIAVVTHSAYLRNMFRDVVQIEPPPSDEQKHQNEIEHEKYKNCELRSYEIELPGLKCKFLS